MRNALTNRRLIERLRLLCGAGVGIEAIAGPVCAIARDLIGADSASLFWRDENLAPAGFYHDCAPVELKDMFITQFHELFATPGEFNMETYCDRRGPPIGAMLNREAIDRFHRSNIFKYLCEPLEHHYCLDVRIDCNDRGVALLVLWNAKDRPFTQRDVVAMETVRAQLCIAAGERRPQTNWRSHSARTAHLIVDRKGWALRSIDRETEELLKSSQLLLQDIPMQGEMCIAPLFCIQLAAMLDESDKAHLHIPIANGRLACTATLTQSRHDGGEVEDNLFVAIDHQSAREVIAVEYLCTLPLTYLQKQIAQFAMAGFKRADCEDRFGVSPEALKKHLRTIYDATGVENWPALRDRFWMG